MLTKEIIKKEKKWISYQEEETEVGMELSDAITKTLFGDVVRDLRCIKSRRNNNNQ